MPLQIPVHDWPLDAFDFVLPEELIAVQPIEPRDHARLMHVRDNKIRDRHVFDLPDLLQTGDVLVINNTKVIPARLFGYRDSVKIEILLNKEEKETGAHNGIIWSALAKPAKRLKSGQQLSFGADFSAEVLEKRENGEVVLHFPYSRIPFFALLEKHGHVPLPPYIKRPDGALPEDQERYQTVYAQHKGAVAAPTAGLHFTPNLLQKLQDKGIQQTEVTLHVGAGTFLPVKTERVTSHIMHAEWGEISEDNASFLKQAKAAGRRIIAVGTTSLRLLESAADESGIIQPFSGDTNIFITPGHHFQAVDALLTNFHLPKSTLFMLVCALAGMDNMQNAYAHAIKNGYRFYSYGDATFLEKQI